MSIFRIKVDVSEIAEKINKTADVIEDKVTKAVENLSIATHAFIINKANETFKDSNFKREYYLGLGQHGKTVNKEGTKDSRVDESAKHVRWIKIGDGIWMVELDEKAEWLEEGREPSFMGEWLLKPGAKGVKTAKDGCVLNPRNKVLTSVGWKKIKDIKAGDMVLTHSGKFREVKKLLIRPAGVGTEYVTIYPKSFDNSKTKGNRNDLSNPSFSLTLDHLVLTKEGWKQAQFLKEGELIATPGDLTKKCLFCAEPLPINALDVKFCLNNSCARKWSYKNKTNGLSKLSQEERVANSKKANLSAKKAGVFDRPDWGARNPTILQKLRTASANAMRKLISSGKWHPETFFEQKIKEKNINFVREKAIKTDRIVSAGKNKVRQSTLFFDFYFPEINVAIELDGKHWHNKEEVKLRDEAKNLAAKRDGIKLIRIPSNEIYSQYSEIVDKLILWHKNHSGELGISWVKIKKIVRGVVKNKAHVFSKKYDICLDAEEHSFCCETIFIHNSKYRAIPFKQTEGAKPAPKTPPLFAELVKKQAKRQGISLTKIEKDESGAPKLGTLHKLTMTPTMAQEMAPGLYSKPRGEEEAAATGLAPHGGIYKLKGAVVVQRKTPKGKIKKETVVFRVISEKHKGFRWMYPRVTAANIFGQAHDWAMKEWEKMVKSIEEEISR